MKTLDDQVHGASDDDGPANTGPARTGPANPGPANGTLTDDRPASPTRALPPAGARRRRGTGRVIAVGIAGALVVMVIHLVIDGVQNRASENAAISKLDPPVATSRYNDRLKAAITSREVAMKPAESTLAATKYLDNTINWVNLYLAVNDAQSTIGLHKIDLLDKVTKNEYDADIADMDKSIAELDAPRLAVVADSEATPAPQPATAAG
jgi:hypothetical protein